MLLPHNEGIGSEANGYFSEKEGPSRGRGPKGPTPFPKCAGALIMMREVSSRVTSLTGGCGFDSHPGESESILQVAQRQSARAERPLSRRCAPASVLSGGSDGLCQ